MTASPTRQSEIAQEQKYFDRAWEARERSRTSLGEAAAAVGGKASVAVAVGKAAKAHLAELGDPDEAVATGRFDQDDGETLYVGRRMITDDTGELLVISWKAPVAAPYYTATHEDRKGVARKRTFEVERNRVVDFEDVVFADLAARVEELSALEQEGIDDAVLREVDATRTGEMRDIVATIHAMQYELVRAPLEQLLVIQGWAGHRQDGGRTAPGLLAVVQPRPGAGPRGRAGDRPEPDLLPVHPAGVAGSG